MRVTEVTEVSTKNPPFLENKVNLGLNLCNVTYVNYLVTEVFRNLGVLITLRKFKTIQINPYFKKTLLMYLNFRKLRKLRKEVKR